MNKFLTITIVATFIAANSNVFAQRSTVTQQQVQPQNDCLEMQLQCFPNQLGSPKAASIVQETVKQETEKPSEVSPSLDLTLAPASTPKMNLVAQEKIQEFKSKQLPSATITTPAKDIAQRAKNSDAESAVKRLPQKNTKFKSGTRLSFQEEYRNQLDWTSKFQPTQSAAEPKLSPSLDDALSRMADAQQKDLSEKLSHSTNQDATHATKLKPVDSIQVLPLLPAMQLAPESELAVDVVMEDVTATLKQDSKVEIHTREMPILETKQTLVSPVPVLGNEALVQREAMPRVDKQLPIKANESALVDAETHVTEQRTQGMEPKTLITEPRTLITEPRTSFINETEMAVAPAVAAGSPQTAANAQTATRGSIAQSKKKRRTKEAGGWWAFLPLFLLPILGWIGWKLFGGRRRQEEKTLTDSNLQKNSTSNLSVAGAVMAGKSHSNRESTDNTTVSKASEANLVVDHSETTPFDLDIDTATVDAAPVSQVMEIVQGEIVESKVELDTTAKVASTASLAANQNEPLTFGPMRKVEDTIKFDDLSGHETGQQFAFPVSSNSAKLDDVTTEASCQIEATEPTLVPQSQDDKCSTESIIEKPGAWQFVTPEAQLRQEKQPQQEKQLCQETEKSKTIQSQDLTASQNQTSAPNLTNETAECYGSSRFANSECDVKKKSTTDQNSADSNAVEMIADQSKQNPVYDDLTLIDGIDSETQATLYDAGYTRFSDIENAGANELRNVFSTSTNRFTISDYKNWSSYAATTRGKATTNESQISEGSQWKRQASTLADQASVDSKCAVDDLTKISGIGPATAKLLRESGITNFRDIQTTGTERLQEILSSGGSQFKLIDPSRWTEQARFAMNNDWTGLTKWQFKNTVSEKEAAPISQAKASKSLKTSMTSAQFDDLTKIRGIGPATQRVLRKNGIRSFEQVAKMSDQQLADLFTNLKSRFQLIDTSAWPAQAQTLVSQQSSPCSDGDQLATEILEDLESIREIASTSTPISRVPAKTRS